MARAAWAPALGPLVSEYEILEVFVCFLVSEQVPGCLLLHFRQAMECLVCS